MLMASVLQSSISSLLWCRSPCVPVCVCWCWCVRRSSIYSHTMLRGGTTFRGGPGTHANETGFPSTPDRPFEGMMLLLAEVVVAMVGVCSAHDDDNAARRSTRRRPLSAPLLLFT
uniref:Putative secreted protein n=1 Tax=Anopheles triannulatus TaxID=58253 RepID=A0A2M4B2B6_9DIPT